MKKIIMAMAAFICLASFSFGQQKRAGKSGTVPATRAVPARPGIAPAIRAIPATPGNRASVVYKRKSDGTPDMRYKANRGRVDRPLRKDGKRDMRYKANRGRIKNN